MNLKDYIGDTRTESLPPGFLKSIKIKYRHEASHVFPRGVPSSRHIREINEREAQTKVTTPAEYSENVGKEDQDKEDEKNKNVLPNLMTWRVPSRLLNQNNETPRSASGQSRKATCDNLSVTRDDIRISRQSTAPVGRSLQLSISKSSAKIEPESKEGGLIPKVTTPGVQEKGRVMSKSAGSKPNVEKREKQNGENEDCVIKDEDQENHTQPALSSPKNYGKKCGVQESLKKISSRNARQSLKSLQDLRPMKRKVASIQSAHSIRSTQIPNQGTSLEDIKEYLQVKDQGGSLPNLKNSGTLNQVKQRMPDSAKPKETLTKVPSSPKRIDKIQNWINKSSKRERKAAVNLLSSFIMNEKVQCDNPKKERIKIALQALERKRTPGSIKPVRVNDFMPRLIAVNPNKEKDSEDINLSSMYRPMEKGKQRFKTWHHSPVYQNTNPDNKSAMFAQPWRCYQRHFSIHPEWGFHKQVNIPVKMTNS